jgi:MFS-type transporter involved in bile tolerance (Atg22 family)
MLRSILAVLAGNVSWAVLWLGSTAILGALFPAQYKAQRLENVPALLLLVVLSFAFSLAAGYLTARLARRKELTHALVLGVLQLVMGIAAEAANFEALPLWYHLLFLVLLIPGNLCGGMLRARQLRESFA